MKTIIFILCLAFTSQAALASSCDALKREIKALQKAQSTSKNADDRELADLQIEYDRKMAKLSMDLQIVKLRDKYKKDSEELAKAKDLEIKNLRETLISKIQNLEKMGIMTMMIDDVLRKSSDAVSIDSLAYIDPTIGGESSADYFIKKIAAICVDDALDPELILCQKIDTQTYSSAIEGIEDDKNFKETLELFYDVYTNDDIDSKTRNEDLAELQNSLSEGIIELEASGIFHSAEDFEKLTFADRDLLDKLKQYSHSQEAKRIKAEVSSNLSDASGSLYKQLIDCANAPVRDDDACNENANKLAETISSYAQFTADKLQHASKFSSDINAMFSDEVETLKKMFDNKQEDKIKNLLSESEHEKLRENLKTNYELIATHNTFAGRMPNTERELGILNINPDDGHLQLLYERLKENGLCDNSIMAGQFYNADDFATCLAILSLDENFDKPEVKIAKTQEELKVLQQAIDALKDNDTYRDLEAFKTVLAEEASSVCGAGKVLSSEDKFKECNDTYLSECMSNNMNSLKFLEEIVAELDKSMGFIRTRSQRHDQIEKFCEKDSLKKFAPTSCSGIAVTNEILRDYRRYNNGDYRQGKKDNFGDILNTALSRQLPSSTNTLMNLAFYQPFYYDTLYSNALYTKQYEHNQSQWLNLQYQWADLNGWTDNSYYWWQYEQDNNL